MRSSAEGWGRLPAALTSAAVAIAANTLALRASDAFGLETARGGLLRLLTLCITAPLRRTPSGAVLAAQVQEAAASSGIKTIFHLGVGLLMGVVYALACEPWALRRPWTCGFICGLLVWLVNALWVLPAAGEGIAGAVHLTWLGTVWFAAAHWLFFLALAVLYARLRRSPPACSTSFLSRQCDGL
jgi:hypothetical protein